MLHLVAKNTKTNCFPYGLGDKCMKDKQNLRKMAAKEALNQNCKRGCNRELETMGNNRSIIRCTVTAFLLPSKGTEIS